MNPNRRIALAATLGCMVAVARAQGGSDPIAACANITDATARLACFDRLAQQHRAAAAPSATAPVPAPSPPAVAARPPDDTVGLDGRQLSLARKKEGIAPPPVVHIVAGLAALQQRPGHQYYFKLDNGQIWESTDTQPDLFLRPHQTVNIRPGLLGAFFLKTEEGNSIRVHRLK